ncbi:hypothetical protein CDD81_4344 [Ophiocordyceps australis]|uniref:Zn(2)-C6 fungal-type domain-containing protein n=1 Tax=Ophiocordyceps australis TaxID=1399860 RepID=A0A2C5Y4Z8_9HYPO|nr:hypothetical protein CDD81_4344 [Ophiocordyceps australis]
MFMAAATAMPCGPAVAANAAPAGFHRTACNECQRRKQKCNREWPCDRCQRRKIADECRYSYASLHAAAPAASGSGQRVGDEGGYPVATNEGLVGAAPAEEEEGGEGLAARADDDPGFDALATARLFATLGIKAEAEPPKRASAEDFVSVDSSPQMQHLFSLLPQRQLMDKLMTAFTHDINYHYYIIYPPDFLRDYHIWWERRSSNRPITLQYTCLLAMICSCCIQHADSDVEEELQQALGLSAEKLSDELHAAVRQLAIIIPHGHYHMYNVQRLLQSCYWYKAEARFLEAWHVLSAAIMEARELRYHREPRPDTETSHESELRRRLWCILDTWDWQISSGLSRPKIINRVDCDSQLPSLTLEKFSSHAPSPLLHMKMQSELTRQLASRFSAPKNIIQPAEVEEYKELIEAWVRKFPPIYDFDNPDTSKDTQYPWIFPHRYYVYTMACLLILNPIRHYMVKSYSLDSPPRELGLRAVGVAYSLKLMKTLRRWVDRIYNRDGRLHFIIFSIFDTAAILCTAILKDNERTIAERQEIIDAIVDAVAMLHRLNSISKTAKTSYNLLERLARRIPQTQLAHQPGPDHLRKRTRLCRPLPAATAKLQFVPTPPPAAALQPHMDQGLCAAAGLSHVDLGYQMRPVYQGQYIAPDASSSSMPPTWVPMNAHAVPCDVMAPPRPQVDLSNPPTSYTHHFSPPAPFGPVSTPSTTSSLHKNNSFSSDASAAYTNLPLMSTVNDCGIPAFEVVPPPVPAALAVSAPAANNNGATPPEGNSPGFELETVTQAQLGELAPLWNWHSGNLDISMAAAAARGAGGVESGVV